MSQIKKRGLGNNIFPINAAVQDNPNIKTIKFNNSSSHPGRSGILPFWFAIPQKKTGVIYSKPVEVIATTVDSICCNRNISKLDFIKADLEGGEFKAFQGALETLRTLRPIVVFERAIEAEKQYGYHKEDWFKLFASCDYTLVTFFGEVMTNSEYYDYWYFYAVPNEKVEIVKDLIFKSVVFENE